MAWPLTPLQTFVSRSTVITAAFMNALQKWVNDLTAGLVTVKGLRADGTGGGPAVAQAGSLHASRDASDTAEGTPVVERGELTGDLVAVGWAYILADGSLGRGVNILSCARTANPGEYEVVFSAETSDYGFVCPQITMQGLAGEFCAPTFESDDNGGASVLRVKVNTKDKDGNLANGAFAIVVWAAL